MKNIINLFKTIFPLIILIMIISLIIFAQLYSFGSQQISSLDSMVSCHLERQWFHQRQLEAQAEGEIYPNITAKFFTKNYSEMLLNFIPLGRYQEERSLIISMNNEDKIKLLLPELIDQSWGNRFNSKTSIVILSFFTNADQSKTNLQIQDSFDKYNRYFFSIPDFKQLDNLESGLEKINDAGGVFYAYNDNLEFIQDMECLD